MAYVNTYSQPVPVNEAIRRVRLQIEKRTVKQFDQLPESAHFQSLEREINSRRTIIEGLEQQNLATYRMAWYHVAWHQQPGNLNYIVGRLLNSTMSTEKLPLKGKSHESS